MKLMLQILTSISLIASGTASAQDAFSQSSPVRAPSSGQNAVVYRGGNADAFAYGTLVGALRGGGSSVFVVPAADTAIEELLAANEDMTVMTRIFSRALEQASLRGRGANPYMPLIGQVGRAIPSVYLDGFGALFTLSVDFPLAPGTRNEATPPTEVETEVDPLWQQTRADIFEPQQRKPRGIPYQENAPEYNAQQVQNLKTTLITTLKHAANIRALGPDEFVVVTVVGATSPGQVHGIRTLPGSNDYEVTNSEGRRTRIATDRLAELGLSAPTALMIRAKASAINSFAKGQMNLEEFRQQVVVVEYPHLGPVGDRGSDLLLPQIGYREN